MEQTPVETAAIVSCVVSIAAVAHTPKDTAASGSNRAALVEQIAEAVASPVICVVPTAEAERVAEQDAISVIAVVRSAVRLQMSDTIAPHVIAVANAVVVEHRQVAAACSVESIGKSATVEHVPVADADIEGIVPAAKSSTLTVF